VNDITNDVINEGIRAANAILDLLPSELRQYFPSIPAVPDLHADCIVLTSYKIHRDANSFEYNLALLEMAYETDILSSTFNRIAEECSAPSLGGYGHIWAKLLRARVEDNSVANAVIDQTNRWHDLHDLAPQTGPVGDPSGNPVWFKDNRWIRCADTNAGGAGDIYNGLDFLSLDVLMHLQPQNQSPAVYVAPSAQGIELGTSSLPYDTILDHDKTCFRYMCQHRIALVDCQFYKIAAYDRMVAGVVNGADGMTIPVVNDTVTIGQQ
jgi:hypothetical protein